jgi:hypothetical protein
MAEIIALSSVACGGSYDESSGLIDIGGTGPITDVRINELMPRNSLTLADDYGDYDDWLELYNPGDSDVALAGYFVSDTVQSPDKWLLPAEAVVPAEGFLILWADGQPEQGALHLGFRLSGNGEGAWLSSPDGSPVDSVTFELVGTSDTSYSRYPDGADLDEGGSWEWCSAPTPRELNGDSCGI